MVPIVVPTCESGGRYDQIVVVDVSRFAAIFHGVMLPMGLRVEEMELNGRGLHVEKEPLSIVAEQPGELRAVVTERDLGEFLEKESPGGLRDFEVTLIPGEMHVKATKSMFIDIRAHAICTLRIVDNQQMYVDLESVEAMGVGATGLVQSQLEKVNPVLDVAEFPIKATLSSVEIQKGQLVLHGTVAPPDAVA